jgi:hypothetical protein
LVYFVFTDKREKRGRPRIRTAQYWREYYTRKQREWRAATRGLKQGEDNNTKSRRAGERDD